MISNPPLGIGDDNDQTDNTLASTFPPCLKKNQMNGEILRGTWPAISGINSLFLFSIQATANGSIRFLAFFFFRH